MRPFRELEVYNLGHEIAFDVYRVTRAFPREELYGLTSQMRRAAYSVPMNIVEGSVKSDPQFYQALRVSLGSAAELEYQLLLAKDLEYLDGKEHDLMAQKVRREQRMLVSFMKRLYSGSKSRPSTADGRWLMAEELPEWTVDVEGRS